MPDVVYVHHPESGALYTTTQAGWVKDVSGSDGGLLVELDKVEYEGWQTYYAELAALANQKSVTTPSHGADAAKVIISVPQLVWLVKLPNGDQRLICTVVSATISNVHRLCSQLYKQFELSAFTRGQLPIPTNQTTERKAWVDQDWMITH